MLKYICPHCGDEQEVEREMWQDGTTYEVECYACGKDVDLTTFVEITVHVSKAAVEEDKS